MSKCDWDELAGSLERPFVHLDLPQQQREEHLVDQGKWTDLPRLERLIERGIQKRGPGVS